MVWVKVGEKMPELPEVETVRRTLENFILNKKIDELELEVKETKKLKI